jgi:hypothetical protein
VDIPLFDKFINLFRGCYDFENIFVMGRTIISAQTLMARERVKNNSKVVTVQNNISAVITEGSDLIDLMHDEMHQQFPDSQITVVMKINFGATDQFAYSIRVFDENIDVVDLIKKFNDDGNKIFENSSFYFNYSCKLKN